jgi:LUD domain
VSTEVQLDLDQSIKRRFGTVADDARATRTAVRPRIRSLDRNTQADEIRRLSAAPDVMLGSVHAVTQTGALLAASMGGSQLGPYASGAGRVILVVGTQKIVSDLEEGLRRINDYSFPSGGCPRAGGVRHPQRREQGPHDQSRDHHRRPRRRGPGF